MTMITITISNNIGDGAKHINNSRDGNRSSAVMIHGSMMVALLKSSFLNTSPSQDLARR